MIKQLFLPATLLMNKLRFNLKFALIILLFLLPLAMLAVSYFTPVMRQLTHTENELRGLKVIELVDIQQKALINLVADDMRWRSGTVIPPEQAAKVATFNQQLQRLLKSELFGEQQKVVLAQAIKKVTSSLAATTSSIGNPQWTPIDRFNLLQASTNQFNNLYLTVANLTGLTNDQEIDTVLLSRLLTEKREFVLDLVSRSYGIVSYAVGENEVSSNTFDSISLTSDRLAASINSIGNLSSLTERMDTGLQDLVKQDVKVLRRLINDNLTFLEEQFLLAEEVSLSQSQVNDFYRQQINDYYQSKQSLSNELESRLNFRVQTMQNSILSVILIVAAVVLVVVYLFVGMSLSISMTTMSLAIVAQKLANGDTRAKANVRTKDELSVAIKAFNQMAQNVNSLVESVQNASKGVAQQSDSVKQLANQTGDAVNEQLQDTQAITSAIGDLLASVAVISENSVHVMQSLEKANQQTLEGRQTLDGARRATNELGDEIKLSVEVIHQLSQQSDSINQVLDVIKSIAEQTNLLALNAAIEAARAGDQGRGFAVVADEVRSLAKRTHDSTEEIQSTISSLQQGVGNAVEAMTRSDQKALRSIEEAAKLEAALDQITQAVEEIGEQNAATEQASQQQTEVAGQIEGRLNSISQISTVTENNVQQSISASQQLAEYVDRLEAVVANFKT